MARKKRNPAAAATATGAQGNEVFSDIANLAQTVAAANGPVVTSIRRGPGDKADWLVSKADWLVSIEGVCTDTPMRGRKLRNYRKFCNAIKPRFGITFDLMPQPPRRDAETTAIRQALGSKTSKWSTTR